LILFVQPEVLPELYLKHLGAKVTYKLQTGNFFVIIFPCIYLPNTCDYKSCGTRTYQENAHPLPCPTQEIKTHYHKNKSRQPAGFV
jgi:hypothetical protein